MAGTLVVDTISNGTVSTSSENVIQGSAKAWVNFDGSGTVAIRASYNVSSITDNGTGDYTINFTNAFANTDYATLAVSGTTTADNWSVNTQSNQTTTSTRIWSRNVASNFQVDAPVISVACFR